jgi:hypothetical protein
MPQGVGTQTIERPYGAPSSENSGGRRGLRPCPACLAENPETFVFCQRCGRLLPQPTPGDDPAESTVDAEPEPGSTEAARATRAVNRLGAILGPISVGLVRAGRATQYDSSSIQQALEVVDRSSKKLLEMFADPQTPVSGDFRWEKNAELAECSSLIEGAASLLALAYAPTTRESLRGLFVHRAYWVLVVAADRAKALLEKGGR